MRILLKLSALALFAAALRAQPINPPSSGGGTPSGPAGGVLSGTYPNPGFASAPSFTGPGTSTQSALGTTVTPGWSLINSTPATSGNQQIGPGLCSQGNGFGTTAGTSQTVQMCWSVLPVQGTTATGIAKLGFSIAGGGFVDAMTVTSGGFLQVASFNSTTSSNGYQLNAASTFQAFNSSGLRLGNTSIVGWQSDATTGTQDTSLFRSAAGNVGCGKGSTVANCLFSAGSLFIQDPTATTGVTTGIFQDGAGQSTTAVLQVRNSSGTTNFSVTGAGAVVASSVTSASLNSNGDISYGASNKLYVVGRSALSSTANGNWVISNNAITDFGLLQFGGTSSIFPALKRSTTTIQARLADDSGFAQAEVSRLKNQTATVTFSATPNFDLSAGDQAITLTGNVTSSTVSNLIAGQEITFYITQDSGTARTFIWPTAFKGAMTISATLGKQNVQTFKSSDGVTFFATSPGVTGQ